MDDQRIAGEKVEQRVSEQLARMTDEAERGLKFARQDEPTAAVARIDAEIVLFGAHVPDLLREVERLRVSEDRAAKLAELLRVLVPAAQKYVDAFADDELMSAIEKLMLQDVEEALTDARAALAGLPGPEAT